MSPGEHPWVGLERAPIGHGWGLHRWAHLVSLMVRMSATARSIWARRWCTNRSVLRRSCPKLENQLLVRSTGQRIPSDTGSFFFAVPRLRLRAQTRSSIPISAQ